jgi:glycosyltransferase involved in cell wall biosynthesis
MRILQLCPLWYPISKQTPGGIESLLAQLGPSLTRAGCELTFLATGDSQVAGELVPVVERSLYELMDDKIAEWYDFYEQQALRLASDRFTSCDLVHSHLGPNGLLLSHLAPKGLPVVHTWHGQVLNDLIWYLKRNPEVVLTTVSGFQREKLAAAGVLNPCRVIQNGIDTRVFPFSDAPDDRLIFVGRIDPQKGPDLAVGAATAAGLPIDIAGPLTGKEFFRTVLEPLITEPHRYVGVIRGADKLERLGRACAMVMPSRWEEPFGMTAIEAMATGTPVVALRSGALPEIVEDGLTGFIVDTPEELPDAIVAARRLNRLTIRESAVARFDISVTTREFLDLYRSLIAYAYQ